MPACPTRCPDFYEITSPPVATDKILIVGGSVIDNYSNKVPSGVIRGFDIYTGALVWAWDAGAADENRRLEPGQTYTAGSPNSWSTSAADEQLGLVYVPLGEGANDQWGGDRTALEERYDSALVALDIATGKLRWSFQNVHHDLWDMDFPSQPSLVDLHAEQGVVPALYIPAKTGNIFVLDRRDGKLIVPAPETPVPQGPAAGRSPFAHAAVLRTQLPAAREPARVADVGRDDVRPTRLPHRVPPAALRRSVHAAFDAGNPGVPGRSRHVRVGRHRGGPGAPDRHRQPDGRAVRFEADPARRGQSRGPAAVAEARARRMARSRCTAPRSA